MGRKRRTLPWTEQRDNGVWYVFWYDEATRQTRRQSLDTRDDQEARRAFAQFLQDGPKSAKHVGSAGVTVDQILTWYCDGVPGLYPGHVDAHVVDKSRQHIAIAHLRAFFKGDSCASVGIKECEAYTRARIDGKVGTGKGGRWNNKGDKRGNVNTVRRELSVLAAAGNWCVKRKLLPIDQKSQIEKPREVKAKTPWLTKDAVRAIFEHADGKLKAFCRLAYYWGARRESIETLTVVQVDLKHGRVDLHRPGAVRTKKRRAIVPIYPEIRKDIETLLLDTDNDYLFGGPGDFYREFTKLCVKAKIKVVDAPDGTVAWPHLLRHSRATHMLMDGEDPYKVAKLLGDTLATVERVYGHHTPEYLQTKSNVEVG